jgi:hypothetical protein
MSRPSCVWYGDYKLSDQVLQITQNKYKSRVVNIRSPYNKDDKLAVQINNDTTDMLKMPFGLSKFEDKEKKNNGSDDWQMSLNIAIPEGTALHKYFTEDLTNECIELAFKNAKEWFGKDMSRELLRQLFNPVIAPSKDGRYDPTLKSKAIVTNSKNRLQVVKGPQCIPNEVQRYKKGDLDDIIPHCRSQGTSITYDNFWFQPRGSWGLHITVKCVWLLDEAPVESAVTQFQMSGQIQEAKEEEEAADWGSSGHLLQTTFSCAQQATSFPQGPMPNSAVNKEGDFSVFNAQPTNPAAASKEETITVDLVGMKKTTAPKTLDDSDKQQQPARKKMKR